MSRLNRRKSYVDVPVQGSLIRRLVLHWLVFLFTMALVAFILNVLSDPFRPFSYHWENLVRTHGPMLIVSVVLLPMFVIDTIKLSHRFAGPVFALRRAMREIIEGRPPRPLRFRANDFWHEVAQDYNSMLSKLGAKPNEKDAITDEPEFATAGK
jgi:hypothetical protein